MKRAAWIASFVLMSACTGSIAERVKRLDRECAAKNVEACLRLGRLYWEGRPTGWVDEKAGKKAFESAIAADSQQALSLSQRACSRGDARSCFEIESLWRDADGTAALRAPAVYDTACAGGYAVACYQLAMQKASRESGGFRQPRVGKLLDAACQKGHPEACCQLGENERILLPGDGAQKPDHGKANESFQRGCEGGSARACYFLAVAYDRGEGVAADRARARGLYERACAGASADACLQLGRAYDTAEGAAADGAKATAFFEKACVLDPAACALQGYRDASRDLRKAIPFLEKACRPGSGASHRLQATACASCLQLALLLDDPGSALRSGGIFVLFADLEPGSAPFIAVPDGDVARDSAQAARLLATCGDDPTAWRALAGAYRALGDDPRFRQIGARAIAQLRRKACQGDATLREACDAVR